MTEQRKRSVAFLEGKLQEVIVRKGKHSVIVRTLEDALRSGTDEDLRRGKIAFDIHLLEIVEGRRVNHAVPNPQ